jgi:hypothetical protein
MPGRPIRHQTSTEYIPGPGRFRPIFREWWMSPLIEKVRFAMASPLEGDGFEPSVPRQKDNAFRDSSFQRRRSNLSSDDDRTAGADPLLDIGGRLRQHRSAELADAAADRAEQRPLGIVAQRGAVERRSDIPRGCDDTASRVACRPSRATAPIAYSRWFCVNTSSTVIPSAAPIWAKE